MFSMKVTIQIFTIVMMSMFLIQALVKVIPQLLKKSKKLHDKLQRSGKLSKNQKNTSKKIFNELTPVS